MDDAPRVPEIAGPNYWKDVYELLLRRSHPKNGKYILTVDDPDKPEADAFFEYEIVAKGLGWKRSCLMADHNPQISRPKALVELLVRR